MSDAHTQQAHRQAILGYLLYFLGVIFGITALIGAIINHVQRKNTNGTYVHSHIVWQLISFWTLFALAVAIILVWPAATTKWLLLITGLCWTITLIIGIYYLWRKQPLPFLTHQSLTEKST